MITSSGDAAASPSYSLRSLRAPGNGPNGSDQWSRKSLEVRPIVSGACSHKANLDNIHSDMDRNLRLERRTLAQAPRGSIMAIKKTGERTHRSRPRIEVGPELFGLANVVGGPGTEAALSAVHSKTMNCVQVVVLVPHQQAPPWSWYGSYQSRGGTAVCRPGIRAVKSVSAAEAG